MASWPPARVDILSPHELAEVALKTPAAPLTVLPAPADVEVTWETEEFDDGMIAKATDAENTLRGFVLLGATAGKQRLSLTKLVPDLIPATV